MISPTPSRPQGHWCQGQPGGVLRCTLPAKLIGELFGELSGDSGPGFSAGEGDAGDVGGGGGGGEKPSFKPELAQKKPETRRKQDRMVMDLQRAAGQTGLPHNAADITTPIQH